MSRAFKARFPGTCPHCDQPIVAGQIVAFIDDDLVHDPCPPRPAYCTTCNIELPASGICGVCE